MEKGGGRKGVNLHGRKGKGIGQERRKEERGGGGIWVSKK